MATVPRALRRLLACVCLAGGLALARQADPIQIRVSRAVPETLELLDRDGSAEWAISNGLLVLQKPGIPAGAIRRPAGIAVFRTPPLTRVVVDLELRCTAPIDVVHRDLEVVFGYQSPTRFYYVHLAGTTDDVHNGVFLVDNADRRRIDDGKTPPQLRDQNWHHVRLERDGSAGSIRVFVDGPKNPSWSLTDTTIRAGRVGVGSFDDTGEFREISVVGNL